MSSQEPELPLCSICHHPVSLETAKADSAGRAIHGECYWAALHEEDIRKQRQPAFGSQSSS
jgi:hypothetical protein